MKLIAEKNVAGNLIDIGMDYILLFCTAGKKLPRYSQGCNASRPRANVFAEDLYQKAVMQANAPMWT